jgi:hypothetical protein
MTKGMAESNASYYEHFVNDLRHIFIDLFNRMEENKDINYKLLYYWVIFEYLQVYKGNTFHCRQFKNIYYNYITKADQKEWELLQINEGDFLKGTVKKLFFCTSICDFTSMKQICESAVEYLQSGRYYRHTYDYFMHLFRIISDMCNSYIAILDSSYFDKTRTIDFANERIIDYNDCEELLKNIKKHIGEDFGGRDFESHMQELYLIIKLLTGDFTEDDAIAVL